MTDNNTIKSRVRTDLPDEGGHANAPPDGASRPKLNQK
jgi:hypothetical protein